MVKYWTSFSVKDLQVILTEANVKISPKFRKAELVDLCCTNLQESDLERYSLKFGKTSQMTPRSRSRKSPLVAKNFQRDSVLTTSREKSSSPVLPEFGVENKGNNSGSDRRGRSVERKNAKKRCPSLDASKAAREEMKQRRMSESQYLPSPPSPKARRASLQDPTDNFGNPIVFILSPKDSDRPSLEPTFDEVEILSSESESEKSEDDEKREYVKVADSQEECLKKSKKTSIWKYGIGIVALLAGLAGRQVTWNNVPTFQRYCDGGSVALLNEEDQKIYGVASAPEFAKNEEEDECVPCPIKGVCRNNHVACEMNFKLHFGRNSVVSCILDQEVYKIAFQLLDSVGGFLQQLESQRLCGETSSSAQTERELRMMLESTDLGYEPRLFYNAMNLLFEDIMKDVTYLKYANVIRLTFSAEESDGAILFQSSSTGTPLRCGYLAKVFFPFSIFFCLLVGGVWKYVEVNSRKKKLEEAIFNIIDETCGVSQDGAFRGCAFGLEEKDIVHFLTLDAKYKDKFSVDAKIVSNVCSKLCRNGAVVRAAYHDGPPFYFVGSKVKASNQMQCNSPKLMETPETRFGAPRMTTFLDTRDTRLGAPKVMGNQDRYQYQHPGFENEMKHYQNNSGDPPSKPRRIVFH